MGWTPVRRRGRPAACLPAPASPSGCPDLATGRLPAVEPEQGAWAAGASGKGAEQTPETGKAWRGAALRSEASFLGRAPVPEKRAGGNPGKAAASRPTAHGPHSGSVPSGSFQPRGRKPANAEKRLFAGAGTGTPTHRQGRAPQKHTQTRSPEVLDLPTPSAPTPAALPPEGPHPPQPPKEDAHTGSMVHNFNRIS